MYHISGRDSVFRVLVTTSGQGSFLSRSTAGLETVEYILTPSTQVQYIFLRSDRSLHAD